MPATQGEWAALHADILSMDHQPKTLSERLFQLLERNHRYTEATGVSHFFVRTLHNLGTPLLERHQLGDAEMTRFGVMIERALAWEPANPYCWMLWAEWFQAQGHRNAHEWTLREMLRLFPNDDHACVELGRVLIDQGEEHWDEAEHWLQQVLMRSPDSGQTAQRSLDRLRAGMDSTTDDAFDELSDNPIPVALDSPDPPEPLPRALKELFRRGRLGGEFSRARIARTHGRVVPTDFIREETGQGDPLAGFYSQWLMPDETPEGPPHAWAWNACRHWQKLASPDQWRRLAEQFPEAAPETEFSAHPCRHRQRQSIPLPLVGVIAIVPMMDRHPAPSTCLCEKSRNDSRAPGILNAANSPSW